MKRSIASIIVITITVLSVALVLIRSARADTVIFTAQLLASNETPPVSNADANAFGNVTVTVDTVTSTYKFDWAVNGVAASAIILSHIHEGVAGVAGPVRVDSGISPGAPIPVVNGSASFSKSGISGPTDVTTRLLANPAGFYFNIHSNLNPGGVVRGQLVQAATTPGTGAPTLSEWGAILMGLLIIAACLFFLAGRSKTAMAFAGAPPASSPQESVRAIDWKLLGKVTLVVEAGIGLALIALAAKGVDVAGALASGLVVAFVLHLLIGSAQRR